MLAPPFIPLISAQPVSGPSKIKSTLGFLTLRPKHIRGQEMKDWRGARFASSHLHSVFSFRFSPRKARQSVTSFVSSGIHVISKTLQEFRHGELSMLSFCPNLSYFSPPSINLYCINQCNSIVLKRETSREKICPRCKLSTA